VALITVDPYGSPRQLAWFGLVPVVFCGILGAVFRYRFDAPSVAIALWTIGTLTGAIYYAAPPLRRPFYILWFRLVSPIGWALWRASLVIMFFLVITPIGFVVRLLGRDPLEHHFDDRASTYWVKLPADDELESYFKQY
jgi:hypothetical protein